MFKGGRATAVEVGSVSIPSDAPQIDWLGARRDGDGHVYPGDFQFSPRTGRSLPAPSTGPAVFGFPFPGCAADGVTPGDKRALRLNDSKLDPIPLTNGVSSLLVAGRPGVLYLYHGNLGTLEWYDASADTWRMLGRLPEADLPPFAHAVEATGFGLAYATAARLVVVRLPQIGPVLEAAEIGAHGLRFLCAPAWIKDTLVTLGEREGRLVLCHVVIEDGRPGELVVEELGAAATGPFARPVANRVGDLTFAGPHGFVVRNAGTGASAHFRWPAAFEPILAQRPYRDAGENVHQLGMIGRDYVYARLARVESVQPLKGPHLSAGTSTYNARERFAVPWEKPSDEVTVTASYGGSLLVPLLGLERDTILLAVEPPGSVGDFIRGATLRQSVLGYVFQHAHAAGLVNLEIALPITAIHDACAFLMEGHLYVYSRTEGRCHRIAVQP